VPKVSGGGGVTQDDITEERAGVVLSLRVTLPYLDHDSNFPAIRGGLAMCISACWCF
jgi:hypothetical protein